MKPTWPGERNNRVWKYATSGGGGTIKVKRQDTEGSAARSPDGSTKEGKKKLRKEVEFEPSK